MSAKILVLTLAAAVVLSAALADAQQPKKVHRIGVLGGRADLWESFRQGLRELGYIEGQNIQIEWRTTEGKAERHADLAAELVQLKMDVVVVSGPALQAAMSATRTIPIVMAYGDDPLGTGAIASLARPGGNVTGLSTMHTELIGKLLELLKEVVPKVSRMAVLWNPTAPGSSTNLWLKEAKSTAQSLGITLQPVEARESAELDTAFTSMTQARTGALLVLGEPMMMTNRKQIGDLTLKHRLPSASMRQEYVEAGSLLSYAPSFPDLYRRAATYVDKILKGTKPADLPVEQPTKFELIINLKAAKQIGLTIPQSVLYRADKVIK